MIEAIRYVNSIGEEIVFGEGCWHYGKTDIFDTSCAHRSIGGRITGFERDIREMSLTVELAGPEEERRRLADVTSYDVRTGQPGTLWANACSMRCWMRSWMEAKNSSWAAERLAISSSISLYPTGSR